MDNKTKDKDNINVIPTKEKINTFKKIKSTIDIIFELIKIVVIIVCCFLILWLAFFYVKYLIDEVKTDTIEKILISISTAIGGALVAPLLKGK